MKEMYVMIGNYGSGKSELALNFAMQAKRNGKSCTLVDLDIINPYFRSSDDAALLNDNKIRVIKPVYAGTGVEGLSLPPDIFSVFVNDDDVVIFDVGGDSTGAAALGQYKQYFDEQENLKVLFVVNPYRPLSSTPELITELISSVEFRGRLKISGMVNNANLSNETTLTELVHGYEVLKNVYDTTKLPVLYTTAEKNAIDAFIEYASKNALCKDAIGEAFTLTRYMRRDWERFVGDID